MSNSRKQRKAAKAVKDLLNALNKDDSDFEECYDSSGDEFTVRKSDMECSSESSECEAKAAFLETKTRKKRKVRALANNCNNSSISSDSEDVPLARIAKRPNNRNNEQSSSDSEAEIPLARIFKQKKRKRNGTKNKEKDKNKENETPGVRELDENDLADDPDLVDILQAVQNQPEWEWSDGNFEPPNCTFTGQLESAPVNGRLKSPYQFFKQLVTDQIIQNISEQTNIYAMQKEGIQLATTPKEIEIMLGIYLRMGLVQMPRVRAYWENDSRFSPIAEAMSRGRFEKLTSMLHFCDNLNATDEQKEDKLWKLRPWLDALRSQFLQIPPEENHAVDEIMVSFKGKSSIKQYIRGKPNPWGFKLWGRAGSSGILYDFDVYQGKDGEKKPDSIGVGGDVVLKLVSSLSPNNYKIFADNYFTSLPLAKALKERSLWYVGTVRSNRLKGCTLKHEKELKKNGRGSIDYKVETNSSIIALRWFDNKSVDVVSSFVGAEPIGEVRRWDKKEKRYITIDRPEVIGVYNKQMGGVDLLDSLVSLYKQKMKSKRWYMYIFWHTLLIAAVNAWLWYKRHCVLLNEKPMKLCNFIRDIASGLMEVKAKLGRPGGLSPPLKPKPTPRRVGVDARLDGVDHLPFWDEKRQRCKFSCCDGLSYVQCLKCNVHLCLNKDRNCFTAYH